MQLSNNGYNFITKMEGIRNDAYQDSIGIWTCGIGFTTVNGVKVEKGLYMTNEEIQTEFFKQITLYTNCINNSVTSTLSENNYDSLVSFCFNVGCGNFKSSTLLKKININPNDITIKDEFLKWNKAGGKVIPGLTNRRLQEANLYFS